MALLVLAACHKRSMDGAIEEATTTLGGTEFVRCSGHSGEGCGGEYGTGWICVAPASGRAVFCPGDDRKPCSIIPMGTIPAERGR